MYALCHNCIYYCSWSSFLCSIPWFLTKLSSCPIFLPNFIVSTFWIPIRKGLFFFTSCIIAPLLWFSLSNKFCSYLEKPSFPAFHPKFIFSRFSPPGTRYFPIWNVRPGYTYWAGLENASSFPKHVATLIMWWWTSAILQVRIILKQFELYCSPGFRSTVHSGINDINLFWSCSSFNLLAYFEYSHSDMENHVGDFSVFISWFSCIDMAKLVAASC